MEGLQHTSVQSTTCCLIRPVKRDSALQLLCGSQWGVLGNQRFYINPANHIQQEAKLHGFTPHKGAKKQQYLVPKAEDLQQPPVHAQSGGGRHHFMYEKFSVIHSWFILLIKP